MYSSDFNFELDFLVMVNGDDVVAPGELLQKGSGGSIPVALEIETTRC